MNNERNLRYHMTTVAIGVGLYGALFGVGRLTTTFLDGGQSLGDSYLKPALRSAVQIAKDSANAAFPADQQLQDGMINLSAGSKGTLYTSPLSPDVLKNGTLE